MGKRSVLMLAGMFVAVMAASANAEDGYGRRRGGLEPPQHAPRGRPYLLLRGGVFAPNDNDDGLRGYDSGWSFSAGIGSRVSAVLALEGMVGAYGADRGNDEVRVMPITLGVRLIAPGTFLEPYLGGGLGFYVASLKEETVTGTGAGRIDDSDTTVGGYLSMGIDAWMTPRTALNFEGSYQFADASFKSDAGNTFDVNVGGWTVNLGVRFEF